MTEQQIPCPRCRNENPPGNRFCGSCGTPLKSSEQLARRQEHRPVLAGRAWPSKLGPAGKALAVGVAALAPVGPIASIMVHVVVDLLHGYPSSPAPS